MQEKLYNLKMKILKNKSINDNLKMELAEEIFQIEKEIAINYTRCCKIDSEQFNEFVDWLRNLSQEELAWYEGKYFEVFLSL